MNCFQLGRRVFQSGFLPPPQQGCAALHKTSAEERPTKKANLVQKSRHPMRVPFTHAHAHAPPAHQAHRAPTHTAALFSFWLARNASAYNSSRSIVFCAIWVCISSSLRSQKATPATSITRTRPKAEVFIASGECPSRF
jgi:hypothetical protein